MAFIYVITNQINGKQYVGKTLHSVEERFREHCKDSSKQRCEKRPLYSAMNKYGIENFTISTLEKCSDTDANEREIFWIDKLHTYHKGYNATMGGEGKMKFDHQAIIDELQICPYPCLVAKKFGCSSDLVRQIAKSNNIKVKNIANYNFAKLTSKKVFQYDKSGKFLRSFPSAAEAGRWCFETGLTSSQSGGPRSKICEVANGKRKTAFGFIWKYEESNLDQ